MRQQTLLFQSILTCWIALSILLATHPASAHPRNYRPSIHVTSGSVNASPNILTFNTIIGEQSAFQKLTVIVSGVPSFATTVVSVPLDYGLSITGSSDTLFEKVTIFGNATATLFVKFLGGNEPGSVTDQLVIKCDQAAGLLLALNSNIATPALSVFPSSLFFSVTEGLTSASQKLTFTTSGIPANSQTTVSAPDHYQLLAAQNSAPVKSLNFSGSGTFTCFARFINGTPGTFNSNFTAANSNLPVRLIPVKTTVLPKATPVTNPSKLTGFTAVQGGAPSTPQSFNLSITGLPTQGDPFVTIAAPKGYAISFSGVLGTFFNSLILSAKNGSISSNVFVLLSNINDTGTISGKVTITGAQVNTKTVAVSGTVTGKSQPTLALDKTNLSNFSTTTFKASAAQSYVLSATNLGTGVNAVVKAPTGYEISLSASGTFASQQTIFQNTGSINQQVFVRLKSQSTTGTISGIVTNTAAGITKNVNVSGTVSFPPNLTVNPTSLSSFSTKQNVPSTTKTYTFVANNLATGDKATVTAPPNYEVREQGKAGFASSITLSQVNAGTINTVVEVRIKAGTVTGTVSGFIQNSIDGIVRTVSVSGFVSTATLTATTIPGNQLSVTAFPNPFTDRITITLKGAAGKPASVRLMTNEGRLALQKEITATGTLQQISIEVPKDIKGMYHLEVNINGSKHIIKMIRQ